MSSGSGEKKQLGRILLKQRVVTQEQLDSLLQKQRQDPGHHRLASTAVRSGLSEVDVLKALSEQHGVPGIDLTQVVIPLDNLALIPSDIARQHAILPIVVKEDRIFLAMADPSDRRVIDEIEFVTGRRVFPYVALDDPLHEVIDECYRMVERGEGYYVGPRVPPDYLASLGLERPESLSLKPPSVPPDPRPGSRADVVVDRPLDQGVLDDDLGIEVLTGRHAALKADDAEETAAAKPKVLIVDDEEDIRRLLARVLGQKGYEVIEAAKGLEALQKVRDLSPDVVLLDAMLPEVHGFEICRRIKGSKRYGHIPIIMVSAIYRGWRVAEDLRASYGVEAFLEKPFKVGDVVGLVDRALAGRGRDSVPPPEDAVSKEAGTYLTEGLAAYRGGDIDTAIAKLREGIGVDPLSFSLHYHLGLLCGRREDVFDAIHALETSVDLQPRHFSALKNLAVLYQRAGFKHKAIEMWERALGNAPDDETRQGIKEHLMSLL